MVALLFPGQGSQELGMGQELAQAFPEARAVFDEVDDALGQSLTSVMWGGFASPDGNGQCAARHYGNVRGGLSSVGECCWCICDVVIITQCCSWRR